MKAFIPTVLAVCLAACTSTPTGESQRAVDAAHEARLDQVLAQQDEPIRARYVYRNPKETLQFFGIEPGMTVVEWLPGQGWYSQILVPYLGDDGKLIGVDYPLSVFRNFPFADDEFMEQRQHWPRTWTEEVDQWRDHEGAEGLAFRMDEAPEHLDGTADVVVFIRALHNLMRFEEQGAYLTEALALSYRLLKPGGVVGVVQHQAPEIKSDDWADGSRGYVKKSAVIEAFEQAGFDYVDASSVNKNPNDQPGPEDSVWRLPPSLSVAQDDPEQQEQFRAIGESNRMTLLFRKP